MTHPYLTTDEDGAPALNVPGARADLTTLLSLKEDLARFRNSLDASRVDFAGEEARLGDFSTVVNALLRSLSRMEDTASAALDQASAQRDLAALTGDGMVTRGSAFFPH